MNIAYILPEFVTEKEAGGLATYYDNVARLLADAGHSITIFVQSDVSETLDYYSRIIVERIYINLEGVNPNIPGAFIRTWSEGLKNALCSKIAAGVCYDLVQYPNFMGYAIDRINIPTVVRVSSYRPILRAADQEIFDISKEYKSIKVPDFIEDIAVMKADAIYGPSKLIAACIKEQTGREVEIIESPFYPKNEINHLLKGNKQWIKDKKYAITFGSLKILKGAKLIGDCVFEILDKCPDLYWIFAGAETDWIDKKGKKINPVEYISERAGKHSKRLVFLGKLKQEELFDYISNSAFCVLPSRVDNLPNTCIEAMALRKVVIGTSGASFEQLIEDGENGFLIERENKEMLISTVHKVYSLDENKLIEMGIKAEERINEMKPEIILRQLIDFYHSVIHKYTPYNTRKNIFYEQAIRKYNEILTQTNIYGVERYLL